MYYLKRIMTVLEHETQKGSCFLLKKQMEKYSMPLIFVKKQNLPLGNFVGANGGEGVLWITDSALYALQLVRKGEAVLVFLHEENRGEDFYGFRYALENPENAEREYLEQVYRRFYGIPWNILETERCMVRETVPDDVEAFYKIYSDTRMTKDMEDLYPEIEEDKQYIRD